MCGQPEADVNLERAKGQRIPGKVISMAHVAF